jgi:hypothetical protein
MKLEESSPVYSSTTELGVRTSCTLAHTLARSEERFGGVNHPSRWTVYTASPGASRVYIRVYWTDETARL